MSLLLRRGCRACWWIRRSDVCGCEDIGRALYCSHRAVNVTFFFVRVDVFDMLWLCLMGLSNMYISFLALRSHLTCMMGVIRQRIRATRADSTSIGYQQCIPFFTAIRLPGVDHVSIDSSTSNHLIIYPSTITPFRLSIHDLASELTPCPNPRPIKHQYPWHHRQQRANPAQQTARGPEAKAIVHLRRDEGEDTS
jgi:hypothetical protein